MARVDVAADRYHHSVHRCWRSHDFMLPWTRRGSSRRWASSIELLRLSAGRLMASSGSTTLAALAGSAYALGGLVMRCRRGAGGRSTGCTVDRQQPARRPQLRRSLGICSTLANCTGGPAPWGVLADLRGDRGQGWRRRGPVPAAGRHLRAEPRLRLRALRRLLAALPEPLVAFRRCAHVSSPSTVRTQVYLSAAASSSTRFVSRWPHRAACKLCAGLRGTSATPAARSRRWRSCWTTARVLLDFAYITSFQLGQPFPLRARRCPTPSAIIYIDAQPFAAASSRGACSSRRLRHRHGRLRHRQLRASTPAICPPTPSARRHRLVLLLRRRVPLTPVLPRQHRGHYAGGRSPSDDLQDRSLP